MTSKKSEEKEVKNELKDLDILNLSGSALNKRLDKMLKVALKDLVYELLESRNRMEEEIRSLGYMNDLMKGDLQYLVVKRSESNTRAGVRGFCAGAVTVVLGVGVWLMMV